MQRLFYKVFGIFCVVIICSVTFTSFFFWLVQNSGEETRKLQEAHKKSELLGNATAVFYLEGEEGLITLLDNWQRRGNPYIVYVIDEDGNELLGRTVSRKLITSALQRANGDQPSPSAKIVQNDLGEEYLFFIKSTVSNTPPPLEEQKRWIGALGFILSGLAMAYFLARYLEKPITVLHNGFVKLASGQLDTRIQKNMGRRKDELSLLGNDFDHMAEKLQSLVESQKHLLHHVSHEIRSPIARLQAIIDLDRQQPEQSDKNRARIEAELVRMENLVSELLTLARLESKSADINEEEINLNKMLEQLCADCQELVQKNQQHLQLQLAEQTCTIKGNEALLYRAFDNIIRNACNYSGQGSQITVSLSGTKNETIIAIRDNGGGVDEADLAHLFNPFYRGSKNQHTKGTGLGLAITQQIIERSHGKITAKNVIPHGFEMTVIFPKTPKNV